MCRNYPSCSRIMFLHGLDVCLITHTVLCCDTSQHFWTCLKSHMANLCERVLQMLSARAKDVLPNKPHTAVLYTPITPTPATEWSHLLLHDIICSERVTVHFQWGGNLSLMTLTFKLIPARDQTRLSCEFGAYPFSGSRDISYTNKKVTDSTKNRTLCNLLCTVNSFILNF